MSNSETPFVAALPMYDWPEVRVQVDALWTEFRARFLAAGIDAPEFLTRRNADMPAVPGGIRNDAGQVIAPDPASLPPDELDLPTLWRHPRLLLAQTCWGPMETTGLRDLVTVVGQPDYSDVEGGDGGSYASAVVMRAAGRGDVSPASMGQAKLEPKLFRDTRLAFNEVHSMSGLIALSRDLEALGEDLSIFGERLETGGHRASIGAVAEGRADVASIDCRTWAIAKRHEPAAAKLDVVGWTSRRPGLPHICSATLGREFVKQYPRLV